MSIWPISWFEGAVQSQTDHMMSMIILVVVGLFIAVAGLAIVARKIPVPGGIWGQYIVGFGVTIFGLLMAAGVM
ncbi:MAG: hypothetical protein SA339_08320 [Methanomassiliicoccus sp.]|nr:hypothetical protein [Methanomassiliicoccus sp.]